MLRPFTRALFLAVLALFVTTSAAAAADTPQQIAETHFRAGLKLFDQSNYEAARLEFLQAQAVFARPSLLRNLALCELKTNRPLEAMDHLRAYLADPSTTGEKRELAKKSLDEAFARTGHASVEANDGATVSVDGQPRPGTAPFRDGIDALPGHRVLEARLGERTMRRDIELPPGSTVSVDLRFAADSVPSAAAPAATAPRGADVVSPPVERAPSFWTPRRTLGVTAAGLAVVAAGVGGAFLFARDGHVSDGKDVLASNPSPCARPADPACTAFDEARDGIKSTELGVAISIGAFVALGVTAALLVFWPDSKVDARLRSLSSGRALSLTGTF